MYFDFKLGNKYVTFTIKAVLCNLVVSLFWPRTINSVQTQCSLNSNLQYSASASVQVCDTTLYGDFV